MEKLVCIISQKRWIILSIIIFFCGYVNNNSYCQSNLITQNFQNPPNQVKVLTWWHWINGNVTKEGIKKDLETMKSVGLGGVVLFNVGFFPEGNVTFMSESWWNHLSYTIEEADRLGLKFGIFNSDGWSMSGGPWITVEESMKEIIWADTVIRGGKNINMELPQPRINSIYEDIAVLAYPQIPNNGPLNFKIVSSKNVENKEFILDNDVESRAAFFLSSDNRTPRLTLDFGDVLSVRHITFDGLKANNFLASSARLEYSIDGEKYTRIEKPLPLNLKAESTIKQFTLSFPKVKARYIRLYVSYEPSSDITPVPMSQEKIGIGEVKFYESAKIGLWEPKSGQSKRIRHDRQQQFVSELGQITTEKLPKEYVISRSEIINLSDLLDDKGNLVWNAPEGSWIIQRIGYTSTHRENAPATDAGRGFECDKMSKAATEKHFNGYTAKVIDSSKKIIGKPIDFVQMESWEAGIQNWTAGFENEFEKRNGYSIIPYLPVMAGGLVVNSYEESNRFLWDLRKTVAQLMSENYWGTMKRLCNERGVEVFGEGSGMQHYLYDPILYQKQNDIPMGEFWSNEGKPRADCKNAASVAHTYGKELVAAEAYTGGGDQLWELTPFEMKKIGDEAFTLGVNQFVLHSYVHQPYDVPPGFTLNRFGNHFQRLNPWFPQAKGWLDYLNRSQYLLRQGEFVGDLAYFTGEGIPGYLGLPNELTPALPSGYDYDGVNLELIKQMKVVDRKLILPSGASYHLLVFQGLERMTPELVGEIERLVNQGATIVAPPPKTSPSLTNYPQCDIEVKALAGKIWGKLDGEDYKENRYGKGKVVWGISLNELLLQHNVPPDFIYSSEDLDVNINYIHRKTDNMDIYFLANSQKKSVTITGSFRIKDKKPQMWNADSGVTENISPYTFAENQINVPLEFDPLESMFIIFKDESREIAVKNNTKTNSIQQAKIDGPWQVEFYSTFDTLQMSFDQLVDWSKHPNQDIKYFSGSAIYHNSFQLSSEEKQKVVMDLGEVNNLATVIINDKEVAHLWKPPYQVEITDAVKAGTNDLQIIVTNTMVNRMIGDEFLPADISYNNWGPIREIPDWLDQPEKRTSGRQTFITYPFYNKDSELIPSGLLGPVSAIHEKKFE